MSDLVKQLRAIEATACEGYRGQYGRITNAGRAALSAANQQEKP